MMADDPPAMHEFLTLSALCQVPTLFQSRTVAAGLAKPSGKADVVGNAFNRLTVTAS
jgi:hypothetical protein